MSAHVRHFRNAGDEAACFCQDSNDLPSVIARQVRVVASLTGEFAPQERLTSGHPEHQFD
jgi:hypothetical protein